MKSNIAINLLHSCNVFLRNFFSSMIHNPSGGQHSIEFSNKLFGFKYVFLKNMVAGDEIETGIFKRKWISVGIVQEKFKVRYFIENSV